MKGITWDMLIGEFGSLLSYGLSELSCVSVKGVTKISWASVSCDVMYFQVKLKMTYCQYRVHTVYYSVVMFKYWTPFTLINVDHQLHLLKLFFRLLHLFASTSNRFSLWLTWSTADIPQTRTHCHCRCGHNPHL